MIEKTGVATAARASEPTGRGAVPSTAAYRRRIEEEGILLRGAERTADVGHPRR